MKRKIIKLFFLLSILQLTASAQVHKGLEIIENYLEAIGGRTILEGIEDETITFVTPPELIHIKLKIIRKAPNKYFQLLTMEGFTQQVVFDGTKGKTIQFGQEMFYDEAENLRMQEQNQMQLLLKPTEFDIITEYLGEEKINDYDCDIIKLHMHNDVQWTMYFDKETGFMIRQIIPIFTEAGKFDQIVDFYNYKDYNGYKYASRIKQLMGPQTIELLIESVEINKGVDDSLFEID